MNSKITDHMINPENAKAGPDIDDAGDNHNNSDAELQN